jgi:serine phosphatase RsbU (regulator of sigma subunit)
MPLEESNILLCFTDGLVEAVDADGAAFDEKRAESLVQQNSDGSAEALTESILSAWTSHTDGKVEDDLTLIAARF